MRGPKEPPTIKEMSNELFPDADRKPRPAPRPPRFKLKKGMGFTVNGTRYEVTQELSRGRAIIKEK